MKGICIAFALLLIGPIMACAGPSREQRQRTAEIHHDLGANALKAGDSQSALREFMLAVDADPDLPEVHFALGLVYGFSMGKFDDAERELRTALALRPNYPEAQNNLATLNMRQGRFDEAIVLLKKALEDPLYAERPAAQVNLAICYAKKGDTARANSELRSVLIVTPKYCAAWRELGMLQMEAGQGAAALESFGQMASFCEKAPEGQKFLGLAYGKLGRTAEARAAFAKCKALAKEQPSVAEECGKYLSDLAPAP